MAYLIKDDYTRLIALDHLTEILNQAAMTSAFSSDQILLNAQNMAVAEVKRYLNKLFEIDAELAKTNSDPARNENIVRCIIVIALYNLHFTVNPRDIPEIREKDYKMCREDLSACRDGILDFGLAAKPSDETDGMDRTDIKSARKFISKPFSDPLVTSSDNNPYGA